MTALLSAERLSVHGPEGCLVEPLDLCLQPGRALTILGESGSGKSLAAQALLGTLPRGLRASGRLTLGPDRFDPARPTGQRALWGRRIAVLPQEPWLALDPLMRAGRQVAEVHALVAADSDPAARTKEDLGRLGLLDAASIWPWQMSGGMAQRLAFAAARAGGAPVTVADEPTKGLDAAMRAEVLALLRQGLAGGGGLICITHDLALAEGLGGEILVMQGGTVVERGPAGSLLRDPQHPYTRALIAADPARWLRPERAPATAAPILRAEGLALSRGGRRLFSGLDLTLRPGEVVGIDGPSGSGKSSLGNVLLGLLSPDAGTVWHDPSAPRFGWQKIWQDPPAAFPPRLALGRGLRDLVRRHRIDPGRIPPLLDRLNLRPALLERRPTEVSGGELQRLAILRALLLDPVMLFADEPTSRLDPVTQAEAVRLLADLARHEGLALLFVSHDHALLAAICDRVLTLR